MLHDLHFVTYFVPRPNGITHSQLRIQLTKTTAITIHLSILYSGLFSILKQTSSA